MPKTLARLALMLCLSLVASCGDDAATPAGPPTIARLAMGWTTNDVCGQLSDGNVWCSGLTEFQGETGGWGGSKRPTVPVPQIVSSVSKLVIGGGWKCALKTNGELYCWGYNFDGTLGDATNTSRYRTAGSAVLTGVTDVTANYYSTCAIVSGGAVKCFGKNGSGELGTGNFNNSNVPVDVVSLGGAATAIAASGESTCAIVGTGVRCWGRGTEGQLGDGNSADSTSPVSVSGLTGTPVWIGGGYRQHCVLNDAGAIQCWGRGSNGEMGNGANGPAPTAVTPNIGGTAVMAAMGSYHTCVVLSDGSVKCWGYNSEGQVGDNSQTDRNVPTAATVVTDKPAAIAAGSVTTCILLEDRKTVKCWGAGVNADGTPSLTPVTRTPILDAAGAPAALSIFPLESTIENECFPVAVSAVTSTGGIASAVSADVAVTLTDNSATTAYYSDAACTAAVTSATIASGSNYATVYMKGTNNGTVDVTATAPGAELTASPTNSIDIESHF